MTTAQMIARVKGLALLDLELVDPTDEGIVAELNRAADRAAERLGWSSPRVTFTVTTGIGEYPLQGGAFARRMRSIEAIGLNGQAFSPLAPDHLDGDYPGWQGYTPGPARGFALTGTGALLVIPPPMANATGTVAGRVLPVKLDAAMPSASSELPDSLHLALCDLAVAMGSKARNTEGSQQGRALAMEADALAAFTAYSDETEGGHDGLSVRGSRSGGLGGRR